MRRAQSLQTIAAMLLVFCLLAFAACTTSTSRRASSPYTTSDGQPTSGMEIPPPGSKLVLYPEPNKVRKVTPDYIVRLSLSDLRYDLYHALKLSITNTSSSKMIIDFNNIWYKQGDDLVGGVILYDMKGPSRNKLKPAYGIMPGQTYTKNVWPERMSRYTHHWEHQPLPVGEQGLVVLLRLPDGRQIKEDVSIALRKRYVQVF